MDTIDHGAPRAGGRYVPPPPAVADLIDIAPLCCILAGSIARPVSTLLPLLAVRGSDGALIELFGHIPRAAALARHVSDGDPVAVLATGPNGYVSPLLVPQRDWGPTWNFMAATIAGTWRFREEETDASLQDLARHLEGAGDEAWTVERMGARYETLKRAVVAFRISVTSIDARFKLGQDESEANFASIVAHHPDRTLTEWMRAFRPAPAGTTE